jgi:hypothetical protein
VRDVALLIESPKARYDASLVLRGLLHQILYMVENTYSCLSNVEIHYSSVKYMMIELEGLNRASPFVIEAAVLLWWREWSNYLAATVGTLDAHKAFQSSRSVTLITTSSEEKNPP